MNMIVARVAVTMVAVIPVFFIVLYLMFLVNQFRKAKNQLKIKILKYTFKITGLFFLLGLIYPSDTAYAVGFFGTPILVSLVVYTLVYLLFALIPSLWTPANNLLEAKESNNGFLEAIKNFINCYCMIDGRASRSEYAKVTVVVGIVIALCTCVNYKLYVITCIALGFFMLPPYICLTIRRLHDINDSGDDLFILCAITFLLNVAHVEKFYIFATGFVWLFMYCLLCFKDSYPEDNKYGEYPAKYY